MVKNEFELKSKNSYIISGDIFLPESNIIDKIIIALHGFGGDKKSSAIIKLAESLTKHNVAVATIDFPGHGESKTDGYDFTVKNCIEDINDLEKYLNNEYKDIEIGFFATSFGAYTLLLKLNKEDKVYNKIVLRCPAINMKEVFEDKILFKENYDTFIKNEQTVLGYERKVIITKKYYDELCENNILEKYNSNNDILIIHGTLDDMAPIDYSIKLQEKFKDKIELYKFEGADHRFKKDGELDKVVEIATEYILR